MKQKTAVFPGSFDPFTSGHFSIVERALNFFDKIVIAIGQNTTKNALLTIEKRKALIDKIYADMPSVETVIFNTLTVDLCKEKDAGFIIRGLRSTIDFEYEKTISMNNQMLNPEVETIFLMAKPEYISINSTIIREIIQNNGSVKNMVPDCIVKDIENIKSGT